MSFEQKLSLNFKYLREGLYKNYKNFEYEQKIFSLSANDKVKRCTIKNASWLQNPFLEILIFYASF